jgi:hypothetical protein
MHALGPVGMNMQGHVVCQVELALLFQGLRSVGTNTGKIGDQHYWPKWLRVYAAKGGWLCTLNDLEQQEVHARTPLYMDGAN